MLNLATKLLSQVGGYSIKTRKGEWLMDICISCGEELAIMERTRAECWECRDKSTEVYAETE